MNVEDVLNELGYSYRRESSKFFRAKPLYRYSSNNTSLRIDRQTGAFIDWSEGISGSLADLVKLTLNLKDITEANKWLDEKKYYGKATIEKPKIQKNTFRPENAKNLLPNHSFYLKRGIPEELLQSLGAGIKMSGKMNNRYVFPIMQNGVLVGAVGRDLLERTNAAKWKIMGKKTDWIWPKHITEEYILNTRQVVLVESIGDFLSLYSSGVKQVLVLFGVRLSNKLLNYLSALGLKSIIIATNNDLDKETNHGFTAAQKIKKKISQLNDSEIIHISLPKKNDFGEQSVKENMLWAHDNNVKIYEKI